MLAARGIAKADHLDPLFCMINSVLPPVAGDIHAGCVQKFRCGLCAAGDKDQGQKKGVFHRPIILC